MRQGEVKGGHSILRMLEGNGLITSAYAAMSGQHGQTFSLVGLMKGGRRTMLGASKHFS